MYATADTPPSAAAQNFIDITQLHKAGIIDSTSSVWMNANAPEIGMWVLNHRSSFLKVYRPTYAGWVRLTRSNARWARSLNATSQPIADQVLDLRHIPTDGGDAPQVTIVIAHRETGKHIGVVADGKTHRPDKYGQYHFDPFTVIDLHQYTQPEVDKGRSAYHQAHAMINGAAIMSVNAPDGGEFIRNNMDVFKIEFDEKHLEFLQNHWHAIETYAETHSERLIDRLKKLGISGGWSEGEF